MDPINKIPTAVEGAFVVLLGQNAILFSLPIKDIINTTSVTITHIAVCIIAFISFFNVAANWVSSIDIDHDPVDYNTSHLFWDISILGILFTKTQTLIVLCGNNFHITLKTTVMVASLFYTILCIIYIIWNKIEIKERLNIGEDMRHTISVLREANITNTINTLVSLFLFFMMLFGKDNSSLYVAFGLWVILWFYVIFIFITGNTLIKVKK